jgi:hypothetical protein
LLRRDFVFSQRRAAQSSTRRRFAAMGAGGRRTAADKTDTTRPTADAIRASGLELNLRVGMNRAARG